MSEPRVPRKAQMRAAEPPGRADHFAEGSGQLPRPNHIDSRDLQVGEHVRLALGKESETVHDRVMAGKGAAGVVTGKVARVDRAGVHLHGDTTTWNGTPLVSEDPVRFNHDDIGQVRRL